MIGKYKTLIADISLVYVAAVWGSTFLLVKDGLNQVNPVALVGYRFLVAALVLGGYLILTKRNPLKNMKEGLILGVFMWLMYVPQTAGLLYTKASNSGFITGMYIAFIPILSLILFKEKTSKRKIGALAISVTGLAILTGGLQEINLGDVLTLLTAMACAFHIILADKFMKKSLDPFILSFQQFIFTAILSFVVTVAFGMPIGLKSSSIVWVLLFLALFPTVSAFVIQLVAQKFTTPIKVAAIFSLEPVFSAIVAWTFGGETVTLNGAIGGSLIVAGMLASELVDKIPSFKRTGECE